MYIESFSSVVVVWSALGAIILSKERGKSAVSAGITEPLETTHEPHEHWWTWGEVEWAWATGLGRITQLNFFCAGYAKIIQDTVSLHGNNRYIICNMRIKKQDIRIKVTM